MMIDLMETEGEQFDMFEYSYCIPTKMKKREELALALLFLIYSIV
jgi:hypothetical protein